MGAQTHPHTHTRAQQRPQCVRNACYLIKQYTELSHIQVSHQTSPCIMNDQTGAVSTQATVYVDNRGGHTHTYLAYEIQKHVA